MSDDDKEENVGTSEVVESDAWSIPIPKFTPEDNPHGMLEESSFATLFPKVSCVTLDTHFTLFFLEPQYIVYLNFTENYYIG